MYLIDSNILIFSYKNRYDYLKEIIYNDEARVSEISRIEVLGYHKLTLEEKVYFEDMFKYIRIISPDQEIFDKAIAIRQAQNVKLADSIIAATALINDLTIQSHNIKDFIRVPDLIYNDPVKSNT